VRRKENWKGHKKVSGKEGNPLSFVIRWGGRKSLQKGDSAETAKFTKEPGQEYLNENGRARWWNPPRKRTNFFYVREVKEKGVHV